VGELLGGSAIVLLAVGIKHFLEQIFFGFWLEMILRFAGLPDHSRREAPSLRNICAAQQAWSFGSLGRFL
jgi:hypothetical protein